MLNTATWWPSVERGEQAKAFLEELGFEDVQVHTDLPKNEIDDILKSLKKEAIEFDKTHVGTQEA